MVLHNAAKFGSTITRGLKNLPLEIQNKKPDIVVLEFGGNDCDFNRDEISDNPSSIHEPNKDIKTFQDILMKTVQNLNK